MVLKNEVNKQKSAKLSISKTQKFSEWYLTFLEYAEIVDTRYPLKGCDVWRSYGFKALKLMMQIMEQLLDNTDHEEAYFPMFVPISIFSKESDFLEGFTGEALHIAGTGNRQFEEQLVVRPTSETVMYYMFENWIRSDRDLPLLWETRHWAQQKWHDLFWGRYLLHAQAKFPPTESVPTLVTALQAAPPEERHQIVLKLGALAHTGTLPDPTPVLAALATTIQDADFWIRLLVVEGLRGFMTAHPYPLVPPLSVLHALQTAVLQDPEEVIRRVAMETLCAVVTMATLPDPPPVVTALLEITATQARIIAELSHQYATMTSKENLVPRWIRNAGNQALLTYIKRLESPTPLLHMLQSQDEDVRAKVAQALGQLGDARAVPPLVQALQDENHQIRTVVIEALGALGDTRAVEALIQPLQDSNPRIRRTAAYVLGKIRDVRAIDPLLRALQDPAWASQSDQEIVIAALRKIGDPQMVRPLIQILQGVNQKGGQWGAVCLLGTLGEPAVLPLLHVLQEADSDLTTRTGAIMALGQLGDARAVEPLIQALLTAESQRVRGVAVPALGQLGDVRAVEPLIQALLTAESRGDREAAVRALGQLGDPRAVEPILQAMGEEEDGLIIYANDYPANKLVVDALVQIGAPAVAPLTQALKDPNPDVREIAHTVLAEIDPPSKRKEKD